MTKEIAWMVSVPPSTPYRHARELFESEARYPRLLHAIAAPKSCNAAFINRTPSAASTYKPNVSAT